MFHYVTDKEYLKITYSTCADIVNQLVQELKHQEVEAKMSTVGSKKRGLITQNEKGPIDYDFNLFVLNADEFRENELKTIVMDAFNEVLNKNGWSNCQDSTSVLTTEERILIKGNKTPFKIDVAIIKEDSRGRINRLIHQKTGIVECDRWYWNMIPSSGNLWEMEDYLKPDYWHLVRETYLDKKNMYLIRGDHNHSSYICYIEAVNEVYSKVTGRRNGNGPIIL